jgi:hypothetical protein
MDQAERSREIEQKNTRLRTAIADPRLDKLILKETA